MYSDYIRINCFVKLIIYIIQEIQCYYFLVCNMIYEV